VSIRGEVAGTQLQLSNFRVFRSADSHAKAKQTVLRCPPLGKSKTLQTFAPNKLPIELVSDSDRSRRAIVPEEVALTKSFFFSIRMLRCTDTAIAVAPSSDARNTQIATRLVVVDAANDCVAAMWAMDRLDAKSDVGSLENYWLPSWRCLSLMSLELCAGTPERCLCGPWGARIDAITSD
jgi:hypothetical protein